MGRSPRPGCPTPLTPHHNTGFTHMTYPPPRHTPSSNLQQGSEHRCRKVAAPPQLFPPPAAMPRYNSPHYHPRPLLSPHTWPSAAPQGPCALAATASRLPLLPCQPGPAKSEVGSSPFRLAPGLQSQSGVRRRWLLDTFPRHHRRPAGR